MSHFCKLLKLRIPWNPHIRSQSEVHVAGGPRELAAGIWSELRRIEVLICEFCTKSRRLVPKLNYSTLHLGLNNKIFFVTFCSAVYLTFFSLVTFHLLFWDVLVQFLSYQFGCLLFLFKNLIAVTRIWAILMNYSFKYFQSSIFSFLLQLLF